MRPIPLFPNGGKFQLVWNTYILFVTLIFSLVISYRLAFNMVSSTDFVFWILVTSYGLDIVFQFRFEIKKKLSIIRSPRDIAVHYLKSWFTVDLLSFVTLEGIVETKTSFLTWDNPLAWFIFVFQATTLLKLFKVPTLLNQIQNVIALNPAVMRLLSFGFWFIVASHFIALGWILIGASEAQRSQFDQYIRALYWTVTTLVTIGYGDYYPNHDSNVQIIFTIVVQVFGVGVFSYIIGNVAGLISNLDVAKAQFTKKLEEVRLFMRTKQLPLTLQDRVNEYFFYLWETRKATTPSSTVLKDLPESLAVEILLRMNRAILEKVELFKNASESFLREVVHLLEPLVYLPGDCLIRQNEIGDCMYFLTMGEVDVVIDHKVVNRLGEGSPFGETALLATDRRTATVVARTYCDVFKLSREHFDQLRLRYPEFDVQVREIMVKRYLRPEAPSPSSR